jgi:hypothetical protein
MLGSGIAICAKQAGSSAQDCNTNPPNPGGGFCCLEVQEGGSAQDGSVGGVGDSGSSSDGALPACTWPVSLDDAAPRQCSAARAYVACDYPGGAGEDCMSNDPTTCPGAAGASCTDLCNADEYAVGCGGVGPAPSPPIPSGCRGLPSGPGGGSLGCCPCGAADNEADGIADGNESDGGTESPDGAPSSDVAQPVPDAFVAAYVGPGAGGVSVCGYASEYTFVEIGSPLEPKPSTVTSGDFQAGSGTVILSCKVDPSGGGFNIQLSAEVSGPDGGSMIASGAVNANGGTGVLGSFTRAGMSFGDSNCSITFTYNNAPVPAVPSLAAGRIWGHINCPKAMQAGTVEIGADGGTTVRTCDAQADFLFENCE